MPTYAVMSVLLAGYLVFLVIRGPNGDSLLVSGWGAATFELAAGALCLARAVTHRAGRAVALTLGFAIISWALGDFALTAESLGGANPPTPSLADAFYLGFYPLAYVAAVLFIRGDTQKLTTPSWLDGAVAGVGTAAVCAAFVFERVLSLTGGSPVATATNLAYPIGDVLLLSLVMGGSTVMSGRRKAPWLLMATGIAFNAAGDTAASSGHLVPDGFHFRRDRLADVVASAVDVGLAAVGASRPAGGSEADVVRHSRDQRGERAGHPLRREPARDEPARARPGDRHAPAGRHPAGHLRARDEAEHRDVCPA